MKGTQPHVIGAAFFQGDVATHYLDHIGAVKEFLDKCLWDRHEGQACLFRRKANGAIQTNDFAVEHFIFKNVQCEFGEILRRA